MMYAVAEESTVMLTTNSNETRETNQNRRVHNAFSTSETKG